MTDGETNDPGFATEVDDGVTTRAPVPRRRRSSRPKASNAPSLRPPTLMLDLLFGALMLFAFQMGDPTSRQFQTREFDLPTSEEGAKAEPATLLPLEPRRLGDRGWSYSTPDGSNLTAKEVHALAKTQNKTPVLMVSGGTPVQNYLDAEEPLRKLGLAVGLAVATEGDSQ